MKKPLLALAPLSLLLAPALAAQEEPASGPLTVEGGLMFWTIVVFVVLLAVLWKFAWPAILGAVEAREKALEEQLAAAERERAVAMEKTKQEQEELLARARREIAAERDRAVADLRREAVDLSLAAASKLVGQRLDGEAARKIVLDYLAGLDG